MPRLLAALFVLFGSTMALADSLELNRGDRVCLVGNTLAERMQHDGWLETLIQSRFPEHQLTFRNLGFSADELTTRLRSRDFGSQDDWLTRTQADVVLAFFGYNESFGGEAGLEKFQKDLDQFIQHTLAQRYNGQTAPRLVLVSPIAHENLGDRNLPDGSENNQRLELYTRAMAETAKRHNLPFVDLFHPTKELYQSADKPLTINGIHLNEQGNRLVAERIVAALFPASKADADTDRLADLRSAVLDKNFHWFHRYRTVDGYSIYGGRADLKFVDGQTNREVMQREMEVLDVMTANRDRRIWAVAQGKDHPVDDSNTPPFIPVTTNKPGAGPDGAHVFLGGEEAIERMTVAEGMQVNLFASEKMFPDLISPVQMAWDTKGRLWVATWPTYPHWKPKEEMNDKLLILEDTTGDGRADRCKVFADGLHSPTGFEFWGGGVLVATQPDILFLKDTTGDDRADYRERILHGIDSADTHHAANSFVLDPGGALYFQEGTFHHTQVETPWGAPERVANAGVFRYDPRQMKFEVYVSHGFANPHGHVFRRWGEEIIHDGTGAVPYDGALFSGRVEFPKKHSRPPTVYQQRTRPCSGTEILSSRHFPAQNQGNLLVANVIGFQGILQYRIKEQGASFTAEEVEPIVFSDDANFRPSDIEMGPDGAIYFTDWQNPIIGHMQHNLRDPSRDRLHGRVYRVTYRGRKLLPAVKIAGEPIDRLLDLLKEPEDRVRYRAKIELSGRDSDAVIAAVERWMARLDTNSPDYEHHVMEALWMHQHHNVVNSALLERLLSSSDHRARAAATRVLCYWRDRVSNSLDLLRLQAADEHPRVRLEAVRAASFYQTPEAIEVALIAAEHPSDQYLDYVRGETMATLEPYWKNALARGEQIAVTTDAGARFFLRNTSTEKLLEMDRSRAVYLEMLFRPGIRDEFRREALSGLARLQDKTEMRVLLDAIHTIDRKQDDRDESVVFDLVRLLSGRTAAELSQARPELEKLATSAEQPVIRQIGFVAIISVDNAVDNAWTLATRSVSALRDLVSAMPLVPDASLRAALYPKVEPLLDGLPGDLAQAGSAQGTYGRFVRIELPRRGTLTLAEVEVYSDGQNVARRGTASQKNTSHGGDAKRAIDGNKSGSYGGGQTHTQENTPDPWWEVDLGESLPIDRIVVYNRTEGDLGKRLDGFTLSVLDESRNAVFTETGIPAPKEQAAFELEGGGPAGLVRRAAMNALTSVRGQELHTFERLTAFVRDDVDRLAAIRAMRNIPRQLWPADQAPDLLDAVLVHVRAIPTADRTSPAALDAMEFAEALAALLPADDAKRVRAELRELGVRVIRIGTLLERMAYDKEVIAVAAGKPVEFVFDNTDLMPHNLVIVQPGSLEEVGLLAEATAQDPASAQRQYVPPSNKVLLASRLLQPRESEKLSFTAPTQPGVYPYVCTYPGHWRRMYGALYVVDDLDRYLENPETYLASNPLPIRDDLLKDRRPRTEWTFDDLAASLETGLNGRSYGNGKQMFTVANCIACHKMDEVGQPIGPDLSKLDEKFQPVDILRKMLEPSNRINEKFQTYVFLTEEGKIITGLIVAETPDSVTVIENPLAKTEPVVLKKADIESQRKSPTSMMPKGLLDTLNRDEILDLLGYVVARGNAQDEAAHGGHHQHGGHHGHSGH